MLEHNATLLNHIHQICNEKAELVEKMEQLRKEAGSQRNYKQLVSVSMQKWLKLWWASKFKFVRRNLLMNVKEDMKIYWFWILSLIFPVGVVRWRAQKTAGGKQDAEW